MPFPFIQENAASRQRLAALAHSLAPDDLARSNPAGWTVAALLAHLAFHDQRHLVLLRRWKAQGVDASPLDSDAINDALKPFCLALEPSAAVALCLASAEAVDAEMETLTADLLAEIAASGSWFRPNRSLHRASHLGEIERLLGREQTADD